MTTNTPALGLSDTEARVNRGWQCPECSGVRISERGTPHNRGWLREECGCQFSKTQFAKTVKP